MFTHDKKITDPLTDAIGEKIKEIQKISRWTKEKHILRSALISHLEKNHYIEFRGHVDKYHLSLVGDSCLYQVPENRRGHLKVFRGKQIRLVCVGSGRLDRAYMAGIYRS